MRGCPWRCRFCQSRALKQPVRFRRVETIVAAALAAYRATGHGEIALLGLSSSDYPQIEELLARLHAVFRPLGVSVSLPSLRVNVRWRWISDLLDTDRGDGLTLAPEAAREEMRRRIGKPMSDEDLLAGCRRAMQNGFSRVKLYFLCGLPGEEQADLDGIVDMAEEISRMGKSELGRYATVVANVSNFIPKPHTPFERAAMRRGDYFEEAQEHLRRRKRLRSVNLRFNDGESMLIEAALCRGDRRFGRAIEAVWRRGARLDAWAERMRPWLCARPSPPQASISTRSSISPMPTTPRCRGNICGPGRDSVQNERLFLFQRESDSSRSDVTTVAVGFKPPDRDSREVLFVRVPCEAWLATAECGSAGFAYRCWTAKSQASLRDAISFGGDRSVG